MALSDLMRLMPPPEAPAFAPNVADWQAAEQGLGTVLPDDYKTFISLYGTGLVGGFMYFLTLLSLLSQVSI